MKKLLVHLDTDIMPSVFVVAYDGGVYQVAGYAGLNPDNVASIVEGAISTRSSKDNKHTALFIGGSDLEAGQELLKAVQQEFSTNFRVSVMLDSNGGNTTAATGVAQLAQVISFKDKRVVVLAGSGPVGQRAAAMFAMEGARVSLTSRAMGSAVRVCNLLKARFDVDITPIEATDNAARAQALDGAQVVYATGAAGVELLKEEDWKDNPSLESLADANTTPPLGIEGVDMRDKRAERHGKIVFGGIGVGPLKLSLHRQCIAKLFEANDQILDAEAIYTLAKEACGAGAA